MPEPRLDAEDVLPDATAEELLVEIRLPLASEVLPEEFAELVLYDAEVLPTLLVVNAE